ncbi:hypothetical protein [Streptomyces sp. NPDC019539]|uniref:hypothetical protein n=1 Tax=Streptomyces sp. NPDC019539 TaxID=3365063 RepID=UPI0037A95D1C
MLHLFGAPGQQRFLPAWRDLAKGALSLVDTCAPAASFDALGNPEDLDLPFAVAVNAFPGSPRHSEDDLRTARPAPQHPAGQVRRPGSALIGAGPGRARTPSRPRRHQIVMTTDASGRRIRRDHGLRRAAEHSPPTWPGSTRDTRLFMTDHGVLMTRESP